MSFWEKFKLQWIELTGCAAGKFLAGMAVFALVIAPLVFVGLYHLCK